ncbi:hypothetical protein ACFU98_47770 [Streptomyces sp. NPDC057575]|uniref:hypothetical protein n=1 Tax=unclassified Streptomyces TaxID=2593676 RepID=UPI0036907910
MLRQALASATSTHRNATPTNLLSFLGPELVGGAEEIPNVHQILILVQYASRLSRRTVALALASAAVTAVIAAVIAWAPVERANLVITLISPILAAVLAAVAVESWRRRRQ